MMEPTVTDVPLSAGTVSVREVGEGEPILFLHGLLVDGTLWREVWPRLAETHRCVVPDWPLGSHRTSMRADADLAPPALARLVAEFIETQDLADVTLIANDTGGAIAQMLVAERPELVGRLVLTSCDAFTNFLPPMFKPLQKLGSTATGLKAALEPMRLQFIRNLPIAFGGLTVDPVADAVVRRWLEPCLTNGAIRRDTAKVLRGIDSAQTVAAAERLPEFGRPALVAWGADDAVFPLEDGRRLAELLGARFEVIEGARAFVPEDKPAELAALVASWLREVAAVV
jgi:pimeloyl-ACP methyl ester carboxylesterase